MKIHDTRQYRNIKTVDIFTPMENVYSYGEYVFQKILGEYSYRTDFHVLYCLTGIMALQALVPFCVKLSRVLITYDD